jgi:replicative DNA helicase
MSQLSIVRRWIAIHFKYPYNDLRKGLLSAFAEQKMRDSLANMAKEEGLYLIGGDFDFRIESLEAAIEECEPDVVFMDGAYLLKVKGEGRTEKAANSFDELKRVAKRNHVPLVASTQFNREVKGNKLTSADPSKIALSDAAGWNADLIFGLVRTDDMKRDRRMVQLPLKFREGEGDEIETHWDFDTMNFDELPKGATAALVAPGAAGGAGAQGGAQAGSGAGSGAAGGGSTPDPDPYGTGLLFGDDDDTKNKVPF